jgi:hypothetical protein
MRRLRPLNEAECYTRLYGEGESTVTVLRQDPLVRKLAGPTGEALRRLFEERLDAREADVADSEAA